MKRWAWVVALAACATAAAADLRVEVLDAIFPGMDVVATTRLRDDSFKNGPIDFPDALAAEPIFQVNGAAMNEIERCASEDMAEPRFSSSREVRLRVFSWPRTRMDLLAVLQYRFIGAAPAGSCRSIPLLVHLTRRGRGWAVVERRLLSTVHHSAIAGLRIADVTGDGVDDLVVESDFAGAPLVAGSSLLVFDLGGRSLRQILSVTSRAEDLDDTNAQVLDVEHSVQQAGRAVCFEVTVWKKGGKDLARPKVSHECYPVGTGVDRSQADRENQGLRPLEKHGR